MTEIDLLQQIVTDMGIYQQENIETLQALQQAILDKLEMYVIFFAIAIAIIIFLLVIKVIRSM